MCNKYIFLVINTIIYFNVTTCSVGSNSMLPKLSPVINQCVFNLIHLNQSDKAERTIIFYNRQYRVGFGRATTVASNGSLGISRSSISRRHEFCEINFVMCTETSYLKRILINELSYSVRGQDSNSITLFLLPPDGHNLSSWLTPAASYINSQVYIISMHAAIPALTESAEYSLKYLMVQPSYSNMMLECPLNSEIGSLSLLEAWKKYRRNLRGNDVWFIDADFYNTARSSGRVQTCESIHKKTNILVSRNRAYFYCCYIDEGLKLGEVFNFTSYFMTPDLLMQLISAGETAMSYFRSSTTISVTYAPSIIFQKLELESSHLIYCQDNNGLNYYGATLTFLTQPFDIYIWTCTVTFYFLFPCLLLQITRTRDCMSNLMSMLTLLFRQGLEHCPTKYLFLSSAMALILGTIYECFVTSHVIVKPSHVVHESLKELVEAGHKVYFHNYTSRGLSETQALLEPERYEFKAIGIEQLFEGSLHIEPSDSITFRIDSVSPMMVSNALKVVVSSAAKECGYQILLLNMKYPNVTCSQTKTPTRKKRILLLQLLGSNINEHKWAMNRLFESGITQRLKYFQELYNEMEARLKFERWATTNGFYLPAKLSLNDGVTKFFCFCLGLLGVTMIIFVVELLQGSYKEIYEKVSLIRKWRWEIRKKLNL